MRGLIIAVTFAMGCGRVSFAVDDGRSLDSDSGSRDESLLLWLKMDEDLTSGIVDSSRYARTVTCEVACPEAKAGFDRTGNGAFEFVGDALVLDAAQDLATPSGTVALWLRVQDNLTNLPYSVVAKPFASDGFNTNAWEVYFTFGAPVVLKTLTDSGVPALVTSEWSSYATWHQIAMTWTPTTMEFWVDATSMGSETATINFDDSPLIIGADDDGGGYQDFFDGQMDDVRIYNRALMQEELAALANNDPS